MAERENCGCNRKLQRNRSVDAVELALNGYRVVATMRDLTQWAPGRRAPKAGVRDRLDLRRLDITEFESLSGAVETIVHDHGRIDVLVNNAGLAARASERTCSCTNIAISSKPTFSAMSP